MIRRLLQKGRSPIGIDVTSQSLHAAQLQRQGGRWQIAAMTTYERTDPEATLGSQEVVDFADVLDRQGFTGTTAVLAVPERLLISDLLELPGKGPDVPYQQLARMELARTHKCSPTAFELATWPLPDTARASETKAVMAAACTHENSEQVLGIWDQAGMDICALDTIAAALGRVVMPHMNKENGIDAVLNLGWDMSSLVVLHQSIVIYERMLAEGGIGHLLETLTSRLQIDLDVAKFALGEIGFSHDLKQQWADWPLLTDLRGIMATHFTTMIDEIRVSFSYAQHRYPETPLKRLWLSGMGASVPGLADPMNTMLDMETMLLTPADIVQCPPSMLELCADPAQTVAVGLSLFDG